MRPPQVRTIGVHFVRMVLHGVETFWAGVQKIPLYGIRVHRIRDAISVTIVTLE